MVKMKEKLKSEDWIVGETEAKEVLFGFFLHAHYALTVDSFYFIYLFIFFLHYRF